MAFRAALFLALGFSVATDAAGNLNLASVSIDNTVTFNLPSNFQQITATVN